MRFKRFLLELGVSGKYIPISLLDQEDEEHDEHLEKMDQLARSSSINILRSKSPSSAYIDEKTGDIVGGLWTGSSGDQFDFDIIVNPKYKKDGFHIVNQLIDDGISEFRFHQEADPEIKMVLDVVNPTMAKFLEWRGFKLYPVPGMASRWVAELE